MHLRRLAVLDFRSYARAEVDLAPGVTTFLGRNGQGKTNLVEAAGYLAGLRSHRVSNDGPMIRAGTETAIVRGTVVRDDGREVLLEVQLTPGRANRARLNRADLPRTRDLLGHLRTVLFAPEDLALVKGDPSGRRGFLDALLVARQPRWAVALSDYDRLLKQRTTLLKQLRGAPRGGRRREEPPADHDATTASLAVWDDRLVDLGSALLYARARLTQDLAPFVAATYADLSQAETLVGVVYRSSLAPGPVADALGDPDQPVPEQDLLREAFRESLERVRREELDRGVTLVGPHRDDVDLSLGGLPARGYASQGESWSLALGLRLASFGLLRRDLGTDPVLVLDDVFAELDAGRRERLAGLVADSEQVLVTAAVAEDVPAALLSGSARRYVRLGEVSDQPLEVEHEDADGADSVGVDPTTAT